MTNRPSDAPIPVEICIDASSRLSAQRSATAAFRGGASRVEVCGEMSVEGLTPPSASIAEARRVFGARPGVLVLIRPRPGDFAYSPSELTVMHRDVEMAAAAGADGVVFGALSAADQRIEGSVVRSLVETAKGLGLVTTFHRAFDAVPDRHEALEALINYGVDTVLTAGIAWGKQGSALDGLETLERLVHLASGRIEIVIGGGVRSSNVTAILSRLRRCGGPLVVHSYSGVLAKGTTSLARVRELVLLVSEASRAQLSEKPFRPTSASGGHQHG